MRIMTTMVLPSRTSASVAGLLLPLLLLALTRSVAGEGDCNLACQQDAPCVEGSFNFTKHPDLSGSDIDLLSGTSSELGTTLTTTNQHCACPHKYTGLLCDIPYESCDAEHPCYNHGKCVPGSFDDYGNEQLFCNCHDAIVDGVQYVGKYCEQKAEQEDYCDAAKTVFCLNGGKCNSNYPSKGQETPCNCPSGYTGPSCQYEAGTVPECDFPCANDGVCTFDMDNKAGLYQYWEEPEKELEDEDSTNMRCICPDDYTGRLCQVPQVKCGPDSYCYHGGTCVEHQDENGKMQYKCDCTTSYTDSSTNYAGTMCQFPATSYCTKDSEGVVNGRLFCVNDGKCKSNPVDGCECQNPYTGFSCEFILEELDESNGSSTTNKEDDFDFGREDDEFDEGTEYAGDGEEGDMMDDEAPRIYGQVVYDTAEDTKCDLDCVNGGSCRVGVKEMGAVFDDLAVNAPSVNQSSGMHENFQHCVCPDGYYGLYCEEAVDICGENEHMCLNGGKCIMNDQDESLCDCNAMDDDTMNGVVPSVYYAGDSCEHPVDDICTDTATADKETAPLSFCVNGGTCKKRIAAEEPHPGCYCEPGFTGPHCELRQSSATPSSSQNQSGSSSSRSTVMIIVVTIAVVGIFAIGIYAGSYYARKHRIRKDMAISLRWKDGLYRDEPGSGSLSSVKNQVNIAPRRSSYFDDDSYPVDQLPSATDPMATLLAPKTPILTSTTNNATTSSDRGSPVDPAGFEDDDNDEDETPVPQPQVYIGPPRDEDGHELHNVEIC